NYRGISMIPKIGNYTLPNYTLVCNVPTKKVQLNNLFKYVNIHFESKTWGETDEEQEVAKNFMIYQGLMTDYVSKPESRWKTRWSDTKNGGATLYQCSCGSDMETARKTEAAKRRKLRQAYEFNGCLAFVRVEKYSSGKFKRVYGYLKHSEACHRSYPLKSNPELKVHDDVRQITELLVRANTSTKDILFINQQLIKNHLKGRINLEGAHFLITSFDVKDARRWVKTRNPWNVNVNRSIDHNLEQFFGVGGMDPELRDAVLYFKPREHRYNHTCLVLATKEQRSLAKQYGHQKYIILNGTFPTENKKIQLYIIMVVDEFKKGIPVGYLLFSRPGDPEIIGTSNHEYSILKKLLEEYKTKISNDSENPQVIFTPKVAIVDLDARERIAVSEVWNRIQILFSPSQVDSCWRMKASQLLGTGGDEKVVKIRQDLNKELNILFEELKKASTANEINEKLGVMETLASEHFSQAYSQKFDSKILALFDGQREMIRFLRNCRISENMEMWTYYGRSKAAESMGVDVNSIPWSAEYLEGFKTQFNPSRMLRFQKKGPLLRLDVLSFLLIKFITPVCNIQRRLWNEIEKFMANEQSALNAVADGKEPEEGQWRALLARYINTIAFEENDPRIQEIARYFISTKKITFIEYNGQSLYVTVKSDGRNPEIVRDNENMDSYVVGLLPTINCHCFHYLVGGGACAHILAAIHAVNWLRDQPPDLEPDYRSFVEREHQAIPFIQLPLRKVALDQLKCQKERKMFYVEPDNEMDEESDSDSEYEDFDHMDTHVPTFLELDSWSHDDSTRNSGNFEPPPIIVSSGEEPYQTVGHREATNEIQKWSHALSVATNRIWANLSDMRNIHNKLNQHRTHTPAGVRSDLISVDNELVAKLKTILDNEDIRNLTVTLSTVKRIIDLNLPEESGIGDNSQNDDG
ncbi:14942_t:CDS:2, partial [Acaulospora morrowiae]